MPVNIPRQVRLAPAGGCCAVDIPLKRGAYLPVPPGVNQIGSGGGPLRRAYGVGWAPFDDVLQTRARGRYCVDAARGIECDQCVVRRPDRRSRTVAGKQQGVAARRRNVQLLSRETVIDNLGPAWRPIVRKEIRT